MSYLTRRLVLVVLVVSGSEIDLVIQMMIVMASSILSVVVAYWTNAHLIASRRRLGVFNEMVILNISYSFLIFNMIDVETNFSVGYVPIAGIGIYILVSLIVIIVQTYRALRNKCVKCCAKRRFKKQREAL